MILGRTTKLSFPTIGRYINKKGYINADYRKYTLDRIVKFPFDVYVEDNFLKAGTEYHLPENVIDLNIKVPTWVDEGNYNVECRAIAILDYDGDGVIYKWEAAKKVIETREKYKKINQVKE